jgi:hypothetical protein
MMPWLRLNTAPDTKSQPPHNRRAERVRSVRLARTVITTPAPSSMSAAGNSHEI